MRHNLDDWERAETLATFYSRSQVVRLSPKSLAILEIRSKRDFEILEKIYVDSSPARVPPRAPRLKALSC